MTQSQVEAKIKEILNKDPLYQDAKITIRFKKKLSTKQKTKGTSTQI